MYAGMQYGGQLPYGMAGYPNLKQRGYGLYLGGIFDTISNIAGKVGGAAQTVEQAAAELQQVQSGQKSVALVPKGQATISFPYGGPLAATVPLVPIAIGAGLLLLLAMRRR